VIHIFLTLEGAINYRDRQNEVIHRVLFKDVTGYGLQGGREVVVADKVCIMERSL